MKVTRHGDAAAFRRLAETWLLESEAEHALLLGLLPMIECGQHSFEEPILLATVEEAGRVCGCAFRTPPFKLGLTRMPAEAIPHLVSEVAELYGSIDSVLAAEDVASAFADEWTARFGGRYRVGMRQRIHETRRVVALQATPPGTMRRARRDEITALTPWSVAFAADSGVEVGGQADLVRRLCEQGHLHVWDDDGPKCMAAIQGPTPNGIRVSYVYTPPEGRRRGYASALTAALTQAQLDAGRTRCFLYTDLGNPTSNAIYARIGYRPVCDIVDVHIG